MTPTTPELLWSALGLAVACFAAGLAAYRFLQQIPGWERFLGPITPKNDSVALSALMHSSVLPMYLTDERNVIRHCNSAFARFLGMERTRIIGTRIGDISRATRHLIYEGDRERFDREQADLEQRAEAGLLHTGDARYLFDLRNHPDHNMRGIFDVAIHVDRVSLAPGKPAIGAYGLLYPLPLSEQDGKATTGI